LSAVKTARVTRLSDFSPFGRVFAILAILYKVIGYFIHEKSHNFRLYKTSSLRPRNYEFYLSYKLFFNSYIIT
jgi:hypothetical protein